VRVVIFCHSLISDWNHGNAHFLRGIVTELLGRGIRVSVYEPREAWSLANLVAEQGEEAIARFRCAYPQLASIRYDLAELDLEYALRDADLVLVHEWNEPELVRRIGEHRQRRARYHLLFHDTHHRSVTEPEQMSRYDLSGFDGVLAFGEVIRDLYLSSGRVPMAWTWHEAADTRVFRPMPGVTRQYDLVWIGNWGDEERTESLREFLLEPVAALRLRAIAYGVRYPPAGLAALADAGIEFGGWLPNFDVPRVFARARVTVHIPRRPYVETLPGIPTIRPFEALACGIPLISAPWKNPESLFTPGKDLLIARNGREMRRQLERVLRDRPLAEKLARHGRGTILARHTCALRVDELLEIHAELVGARRREGVAI
jgi:spore maturation protein CgeB